MQWIILCHKDLRKDDVLDKSEEGCVKLSFSAGNYTVVGFSLTCLSVVKTYSEKAT